jgi:hypothetical protein
MSHATKGSDPFVRDTLRRVKKTSIYLEPALDEALAKRAAQEGVTKAEFIRRTLWGAVTRPKRPKPSIAVFSSRR